MMHQKMRKRIIMLGMCFVLMFGMTERVTAMEKDWTKLADQLNAESSAGGRYAMGLVAAYGEEDFMAYGLAVFAQAESQAFIFTTYAPLAEGAVGYVAQMPNGEYIEIEAMNQVKEAELMIWQPKDENANVPFNNIGLPYKQQQVQVICADREGNFIQHKAVVTGIKDPEIGTITLEFSDEIDELFAPAAVLDMDGNCVAVITSKEVVALILDQEFFNSNGSTQSGTIGGGSSEGGSTSGSSSGGSNGGGQSGLMSDIMTGGICGVIGLLLYGLLLKRKKDKEKKSQQVEEPMSFPEDKSQNSWEEIPPKYEEITPRYEEPKKQSSGEAIKLYALGGYMDGRIYSIDKNAITFGRDASSTICYPANTKGVSRVHCKLFWKNGTLMLMDMGSSYGTYLKGKGRLNIEQPVAVKAGDVFYIGEKNNSFVIK